MQVDTSCGRKRAVSPKQELIDLKEELRSNSAYPLLRGLIQASFVLGLLAAFIYGGILFVASKDVVALKLLAAVVVIVGCFAAVVIREASHSGLDLLDATLEGLRQRRAELELATVTKPDQPAP